METFAVDLSDWSATEQLLQRLSPIDALVNNAAIVMPDNMTQSRISEASVDQMLAVNFKSVVNVSQLVAQQLIRRETGGAIVNVSSQAALASVANHAVYSATKGGLDSLTRSFAFEFGPHGIRCNSVNPTVVLTDRGRHKWAGNGKEAYMRSRIPLRQFAEPQDVVSVILFLLSDAARMINGVNLPIDGGFLCHS